MNYRTASGPPWTAYKVRKEPANHLVCIGDHWGQRRAHCVIDHLSVCYFLVPSMKLGLWGRTRFGEDGKQRGMCHLSSFVLPGEQHAGPC